ncbi:serine hydrolase [Chitinophaga sancti]|uniref:serine hydrolase n=1 Tax=Chitinophaga sancti TaxID=1004 RepID=UPI002A7511BA|nr:serine hydrolase [Chitinophaga sancti]WPQ60482.1 serine hydrolase [Chitinophaga sancti]
MKKAIFSLGVAMILTIPTYAQPFTQLFRQAIESGMFSGQAVILKDGAVFYGKQNGFSENSTKRPLTANTLYNTNYLTKQFTEEIIRQLISEGKLDELASVDHFVNIFPPETGKAITVAQLLTMRSGLGDYEHSPDYAKIRKTDFKLNDLLQIISWQPLLFNPGTGEAYSNSAYVVLGAVIEKITGQSYGDAVRTRIGAPLGMTSIAYTRAEKLAATNRAYGQIVHPDGTKTNVDDIENGHPDEGVYATLDDMLKFVEAKRKQLLPSHYSYPLTMHMTGRLPTWTSAIGYTEDGYSYVILCNMGESADRLAPRVISVMKDGTYQPFTPPTQLTLYKWITGNGMPYVEQNVRSLCEQEGRKFDADFLNANGDIFMQSKQTGFGIALFKLNVKLFPTSAIAYEYLGNAYTQIGDKVNAEINYKKVMELDPKNGRVKDILSVK